METTSRLDLLTGAPLGARDDAATGDCCAGGACMCSSGAASERMPHDRVVTDPIGATTTAATAPATDAGIEFLVTGMTCGHCVASVSEEVGAIAGVESVDVVLKKGGASRVTVHADGPVDVDAVRAAVEEAGYQLA
jgi:copper ion binding protein